MEPIYISTDKRILEIETIHSFLSERSYWAQGRSFDAVKSSIDNSICFGMYNLGGKQVGFARVITDYNVFAWVLDVFILEQYRGNGYGKMLMNYIVNYPNFSNVKKLGLATADAHGLYSQYGFCLIKKPENVMELIR